MPPSGWDARAGGGFVVELEQSNEPKFSTASTQSDLAHP